MPRSTSFSSRARGDRVDLLLNELSLSEPAPDRVSARARVEGLLATVRAATGEGLNRVLRTCQDFWGTPLSEGYTVAHWLQDAEVDLELRRLLKAFASKGPFIDELLESSDAESGTLSETCAAGRSGKALGLATRLDAPLVSAGVEPWETDPLTVESLVISDDGSSSAVESVCNLFGTSTVEARRDWIRGRLRNQLRTGSAVVERMTEVLQRLDLTDGAREQLLALTGNEQPFPFVVKHLMALDAHARGWTQGHFLEGFPFDCSDESDQTLAQFAAERTFLCPDGERRLFRLHSKVRVGEWRVYFIPDRESGRVTVGYIGPHLSTVRFRT